MKTPYSIIITSLCIVLIISCRDERNKTADDQKVASHELIEETKDKKAVNYDSLFQKILPLQNSVMQNPDDRNAMQMLLDAVYDSETALLYCVGKGAANPKLPPAVQQQGMKRAAQLTGERWALYLTEWHKGNFVALTSPIAGNLSTGGTLLFEKTESDTLFLLLSVPVDSAHIL